MRRNNRNLIENAEEIQTIGITFLLTHRDQVTHICVSKLNIMGSDNGLSAGARPTNDISIEFEIRPHLAVLWFEMCSTNHN